MGQIVLKTVGGKLALDRLAGAAGAGVLKLWLVSDVLSPLSKNSTLSARTSVV